MTMSSQFSDETCWFLQNLVNASSSRSFEVATLS